MIEQFDLTTGQGPLPTLQEVINTLHSRDERDKMVEQATDAFYDKPRAVMMNVKAASEASRHNRISK